MARYIGAKTKISRKFGEPLFGPDKHLVVHAPGAKGAPRKKKISVYGQLLLEKQKVRFIYGVLEKQFSNLFKKAQKLEGVTGTRLIQLLESRLDNVVFRAGFSPTRAGARQLVSHGHILVDGKRVNIPSYSVKPGETISLKEKTKNNVGVTENLKGFDHGKYSWIEWNADKNSAKFLRVPDRESVPENINEQLVVEFYSK